MAATPQLISPTQAAHQLHALTAVPGTDLDGFFGPTSILWRVNREAGLFLGAGRAALLQLAHPWVAAAIDQHSQLRHDAIGRFHSTFRVIYTMVFGTRTQALAASRQLYRRHQSVTGELPAAVGPFPAGQRYEANETAALVWVFATLADTAVLAYNTVRPPLSVTETELYCAEFRRMGTLFGIPPDAMPPTWSAFIGYMDEMLASPLLAVDGNGRSLGQAVLSGVGTWVRPPRWYRALTTLWLPPHLRTGFGLLFSPADQRSAARALRWLPRIYPFLPKPLRYVGPYREARARLMGQVPGPWTRLSNRFWMGQPHLLRPPTR